MFLANRVKQLNMGETSRDHEAPKGTGQRAVIWEKSVNAAVLQPWYC